MKQAVVVLLLALLVFSPMSLQAKDAPGCEGLEQFRAELFPIGERWADALLAADLGPSRSPITFSSDDWLTYAEIALEAQRDLKTVDAPDWLDEWLAVRIESTGMQQQIGMAAAEGGAFVILGFEGEVDALSERAEQTEAAAIERCPDFAQFAYDWDAQDGEVDGTPVAQD